MPDWLGTVVDPLCAVVVTTGIDEGVVTETVATGVVALTVVVGTVVGTVAVTVGALVGTDVDWVVGTVGTVVGTVVGNGGTVVGDRHRHRGPVRTSSREHVRYEEAGRGQADEQHHHPALHDIHLPVRKNCVYAARTACPSSQSRKQPRCPSGSGRSLRRRCRLSAARRKRSSACSTTSSPTPSVTRRPTERIGVVATRQPERGGCGRGHGLRRERRRARADVRTLLARRLLTRLAGIGARPRDFPRPRGSPARADLG